MTLSCADLRWNGTFQIIAKTRKITITDEKLDHLHFAQKCPDFRIDTRAITGSRVFPHMGGQSVNGGHRPCGGHRPYGGVCLLKLVVLVKLAFAMKRLKKYL